MIRWVLSGFRKGGSLGSLMRRRDLNRGTCRLTALAPAAPAEVWLESGWVVHAEYGPLEGVSAAQALLEDETLRFAACRHLPIPRRSMHLATEELIRPEGRLLRPRAPTPHPRRSLAGWLRRWAPTALSVGKR